MSIYDANQCTETSGSQTSWWEATPQRSQKLMLGWETGSEIGATGTVRAKMVSYTALSIERRNSRENLIELSNLVE